MTPELFWGQKELSILVSLWENGTLRLAPDTFAAFRNWPLPKTQKHINYFEQCILMVIVFTITLENSWYVFGHLLIWSISPLVLMLVCHLKWHTFFRIIRNHRLQSNDSLHWSLISTSCCSISHFSWLITMPCWQIGQYFWWNWIPNSIWVRLDILKLIALLHVSMK